MISADEKSQLQALGRRHRTLPPAPGRPSMLEFEYRRGGTLAYLAAWDVPSENVIVAELWRELEFAVENARRVMVVGHSLHDQPLVDVLSGQRRRQKLAVSCFDAGDQKRVKELLPEAVRFKLDFGPEAKLSPRVLAHLGIR